MRSVRDEDLPSQLEVGRGVCVQPAAWCGGRDARVDGILLVTKEPMQFEQELEREMRQHITGMLRLYKPFGTKNLDKKEVIFQEGVFTPATVHAAKGYDCPIVLLFGVDTFETDVESRAAFYVTATRARMRLFVSGPRKPGSLADEAEALSTLLRTQPVAVREEVAVVFEPAFRKGECVRDRKSRTGTVLADSQKKPLPSQKGEYQSVRVDFGGVVEELVWPLAQLDRV